MFPINEQFANATRNVYGFNELLANPAKNMFPNTEQFIHAARTSLTTQLSALTALTSNALESMEKVMDLNLSVAKASLQDSAVTTRELLFAKDPQEFVSLAVAQAQPTVVKAVAYSRHLAGIAAAGKTEFSRAVEEQMAEAKRKVSALVDEACKGAPVGSENAIAIMKSAITNASTGYEQFTKGAKQAADALEANRNTTVKQFSQAAKQKPVTATSRSRTRKH
jgi:phasin family protein